MFSIPRSILTFCSFNKGSIILPGFADIAKLPSFYPPYSLPSPLLTAFSLLHLLRMKSCEGHWSQSLIFNSLNQSFMWPLPPLLLPLLPLSPPPLVKMTVTFSFSSPLVCRPLFLGVWTSSCYLRASFKSRITIQLRLPALGPSSSLASPPEMG